MGVNVENLDMKEMIYTQTQKDVAETKIHHLLSENLFMPKNRVFIIIIIINGTKSPLPLLTRIILLNFIVTYIFILIIAKKDVL